MTRIQAGLTSLILVAALGGTALAEGVTALPDDEPVTINDIEVACTGIGDEAQSDPRWTLYPVRLEFAGGKAQYLADVDVTLLDASGGSLMQVRCDSPWLLVKLPHGKYTVKGTFRNLTKSSNFVAPKAGQARIIVRFPEIIGSGDN